MSLERLVAINEKAKREGRMPVRFGQTVIGRGVDMADKSKDVTISIPDRERSGHLGLFGTTRIGKTRLIENIVEQDIRKGYNVVVVDPKGDIDLFSKLIQVSAEVGRLDEVMMLTPIYPDCSIKLDPLAHYYLEDELVDHVISGIKSKEDYYIAIASEVTQAVVAGLALQARYQNKDLDLNFAMIKERSTYSDLTDFKAQLMLLKDSVPEVSEIIANLDQILKSTPDFFSKVASSLRTMLSALSSGNTGKIIGRARKNEFVDRFENGQGVILFCNTGSLLARRTAHIIGKVIISMIQSMVGRFFVAGKTLDPPLCIHIDEAHNVSYDGIQELFSKGGGADAWVHYYTQSIAFIEKEIGPEATHAIIDCMNHLVFMKLNHPETAQHVEDSSPDKTKFQYIITPDDTVGRVTLREVDEKLITAARVLDLSPRFFYMRSRSRWYKGRTEDTSPAYVEVTFPKVTGRDVLQSMERI